MRPAHTIRRATLADLPDLLALEACSFEEYRLSKRQIRYHIRHPRNAFLVCDLPAHPCAGALLLLRRRKSARLYSVAVHPDARGKGVARGLCQAAESVAQGAGIASIALEVKASNTAAVTLYHDLGYAIATSLPDYYGAGAPGLRMVKPLAKRTPIHPGGG